MKIWRNEVCISTKTTIAYLNKLALKGVKPEEIKMSIAGGSHIIFYYSEKVIPE